MVNKGRLVMQIRIYYPLCRGKVGVLTFFRDSKESKYWIMEPRACMYVMCIGMPCNALGLTKSG